MQLDPFTAAYVEAALWSSMDDNGEPLDRNFTDVDDFAPEAIEKIIDDCQQFQAENEIPSYNSPEWSDAALAGHDFFLTRNSSGVGFWSRGLGEVGRKLTEAAHAFGSCDIYQGNDGQLYIC